MTTVVHLLNIIQILFFYRLLQKIIASLKWAYEAAPGKSVTSPCALPKAAAIEATRRMCSPSYPALGWKKTKVSLLGSEGGEN